jgi:hypothetical protein
MSAVAVTPAPPKPASPKVEDKGIELKDLRKNAEGIVSVEPREVAPSQHHVVTESRLFMGYGGPLAIEDKQGRGLFKALGGDGIYTLDDGSQYVVAADLAEALGILLPAPAEAEVAAMAGKLDEFEAEQREKAEKDAQTRGKKVEVPAHTTPAPTPTR